MFALPSAKFALWGSVMMNEEKELVSDVSARLRAFRSHTGLSQEKFGDLIGGTKRGVQANESGRNAPQAKALSGLARLGLNLNWLIAGVGPMLMSELTSPREQTAVDAEKLGFAVAAVEKGIASRQLRLTAETRGKLAALVYQYCLPGKTNTETSIYVTQLVELVSNAHQSTQTCDNP
ncbi:MAG: helix-turn-helix transcriptional regulator [Burkholderia gladioli]